MRFLLGLFLLASTALPAESAESGDADAITVTGALEQWRKVTLTIDGPWAKETDQSPNPFTDLSLEVACRHESGEQLTVQGYFAADGTAGESSAEAGDKWRAHLAPHKTGRWSCVATLVKGRRCAIDDEARRAAELVGEYHCQFTVAANSAVKPDLAAVGRLRYVGERYLRFAGSGDYFLKVGPDTPETLLAYQDFDGTRANNPDYPLKFWGPHRNDWRAGDPTWRAGKGKGLVGAVNYLSAKGLNTMSFLTYNAGGDGDNVWPFVERDSKLHYDCSKLDQWGVVFDHATRMGLHLHFKLQETENDDNRNIKRERIDAPVALDEGRLGPERKLYLRELVSRYGHALAMNWNLGEENSQSTEEVIAMARYIRSIDPYHHPIVLHTWPDQQEMVYDPLLGKRDGISGLSLQNSWNSVHQLTLKWIDASADAGHPWVVANDEQNPATMGVPPDIGYRGGDGRAVDKEQDLVYDMHGVRKHTLWGNLMAGGAGVEYYFGYELPENDRSCEDFRSRDQTWDYCRIARQFFLDNHVPFSQMKNADRLVGNPEHDNSRYCFALPGEIYLVYLPEGGECELLLDDAEGDYTLGWFNPVTGGDIVRTSEILHGRSTARLSAPDSQQDWLAVIQEMETPHAERTRDSDPRRRTHASAQSP